MATPADFETIDAATVEAWIREGQEEHLYLDFKSCPSERLERQQRRDFAIGLTGFANSDGGLIVWGVRTERVEGVDRAAAIEGFKDARAFTGHLNEIVASSSSPTLAGVRHRVIATSSGDVVVTLSPRSEFAPHMARAGEDRYFRRAGSSFRRMEEFEIKDILSREVAPHLEVRMRLRERGGTGGPGRSVHNCVAIVSLYNSGRVSARAPLLEVSPNGRYVIWPGGLDGNGQVGLPMAPVASEGSTRRFVGDAATFIHPGVTHDVVGVLLPVEVIQGKVVRPEPLSATCRIAAERFALREVTVEASPEAILNAVGIFDPPAS
ncbi:MAG TPA: ATP-binding protein [Hyphomonadaceae bacterium]|nr:ATP-binding protein [Hyphomonadaceae bacterium]